MTHQSQNRHKPKKGKDQEVDLSGLSMEQLTELSRKPKANAKPSQRIPKPIDRSKDRSNNDTNNSNRSESRTTAEDVRSKLEDLSLPSNRSFRDLSKMYRSQETVREKILWDKKQEKARRQQEKRESKKLSRSESKTLKRETIERILNVQVEYFLQELPELVQEKLKNIEQNLQNKQEPIIESGIRIEFKDFDFDKWRFAGSSAFKLLVFPAYLLAEAIDRTKPTFREPVFETIKSESLQHLFREAKKFGLSPKFDWLACDIVPDVCYIEFKFDALQ